MGISSQKYANIFRIFLVVTLLFIYSTAEAHIHNEASYQQAWANKNHAVCEYKNDDGTRVDCLTKTHAIEFDFAKKWAEAIGQALYYQHKTGRRAMVILILEYPEKEYIYLERVKALAQIHDFDVGYVTPDILKTDSLNRCKNPKCRCHKIHN
ncbi:MAG: hypothetical protein K6E29_07360 [Cyanobacteria bacterium RUI128]|nr:hypothetical protein [Cyanobacteria bacterium RUI128]